jgi:hypothetical protein
MACAGDCTGHDLFAGADYHRDLIGLPPIV